MLKKKTLLMGAAGLASIAIFGALFTDIAGDFGPQEQLKFAMSILDEGRWDVAGRIARDLEGEIDKETDAAWHYVQGVAALKSVENRLDIPKSRRLLRKATDHLTTAKDIGFPPGYKGKGRFFLGWCFFHTYRWADAVEQLRDSHVLWPKKRSEAFQMMVESQLRTLPPDVDASHKTLTQWKAIPGLSDSESAKIKLAEAQVEFEDLNLAKTEELLLDIPAGTPEFYDALVWRGRWRLERATERDVAPEEKMRLLREAEEILRTAKVSAETPRHIRRQATYMSGRAVREQGKHQEAMGTFISVRQTDPKSAEAIASGVEEAEILLELGKLHNSISTARNVLRNIEDLSLYNEKWLIVPELKRRLLDIGRAMRDMGEYEKAIRLSEDLGLAFPFQDSLRLQGETFEQWGDELDAAGDANRAMVVGKYRTAARRFEQLAKLELRSADYTDILWRSINCYQKANDLKEANTLLRDYIRYEDRTKRPRGYLALGKNYMHTGNWKSAIEPLDKCLIEYPEHPISFDARLMAAQAKRELNQLDAAIDLLEENLWGFDLRPTNQVWRNSMFELGEVVYRQGDQLILETRINPHAKWEDRKAKLEASHHRFSNAIETLSEAATRWAVADEPRHLDAKYLVAKSHRLAAEMPRQLIEANPTMIDSARRKLLQQRRDRLEEALDEFRALHDAINQNVEFMDSQDKTAALLRNCYFGEADTLYELGNWEQAIAAYQSVTARFMNQPESLEALLQMAHCYRKLGKDNDAKKMLATAKQVLARIPNELDHRFTSVTRTSRDEWGKLINMMQGWD